MAIHVPIAHSSDRAIGPASRADAESRAWLTALRSAGADRDAAIPRLHELLLSAARFELSRRSAALSDVGNQEVADIALQAADDARVAVLTSLDDYRGASRFTTWASKFALLEAAVRVRRRAWHGREIVNAEAWPEFEEIADSLTPHERDVLTALVLGSVPIDVLAERLNTTRAALYETLHGGRRKLRARLVEREEEKMSATAMTTPFQVLLLVERVRCRNRRRSFVPGMKRPQRAANQGEDGS